MKNFTIKPEKTAMAVSRESESARKLLKLTQEKSNPTVLDYGCGLTRNMKYILSNNKSCHVDGCDTENQVQNVLNDNEKKKFFIEKNSTITTSDKLDIQYDFILSSHVLNVVLDDVKMYILKDMHRLLKDNGKAIIQVRTSSDVESAKSKEKFGSGWLIKKGKDVTFQEGITKEKMVSMLEEVGFKILNHKFTKSLHLVEVTK